MQALNSDSDLNFILMLKYLSQNKVTHIGRILQREAKLLNARVTGSVVDGDYFAKNK